MQDTQKGQSGPLLESVNEPAAQLRLWRPLSIYLTGSFGFVLLLFAMAIASMLLVLSQEGLSAASPEEFFIAFVAYPLIFVLLAMFTFFNVRVWGVVLVAIGSVLTAQMVASAIDVVGLGSAIGMGPIQGIALGGLLVISSLMMLFPIRIGLGDAVLSGLDKASSRRALPRPKQLWQVMVTAVGLPSFAVHGPKKPIVPLFLVFVERTFNAIYGYFLIASFVMVPTGIAGLWFSARLFGEFQWIDVSESFFGVSVLSALISTFVAWVIFLSTRPLARFARNRLALAYKDINLDRGERPVLFLRAFRSDQEIISRTRGALSNFSSAASSIDQIILETLSPYGPVIAIGDPKDRLPPFGAARRYVEGEDWQDVVSTLGRSSCQIALLMGGGAGVRWEIDHIFASHLEDKTVFLFPAEEIEGAFSWQEIAGRLGIEPEQIGKIERRLGKERVIAIGKDANGTPQIFRSKLMDAFAFETTLRKAVLIRSGHPPGSLDRPRVNKQGRPWQRWLSSWSAAISVFLASLLAGYFWYQNVVKTAQTDFRTAAQSLLAEVPDADLLGDSFGISKDQWSKQPMSSFMLSALSRHSEDEIRKAARSGNADAQLIVSFIEEDRKKAALWVSLAANQNHPRGMRNMGHFFEKGSGVERDLDRALVWYVRAAEAGNAMAQERLGYLLTFESGETLADVFTSVKNQRIARKWAQTASAQNYPEGQFRYARVLATGAGGPHDYVEAAKLYRKAAEAGHLVAANNLGVLYERGRGVEKDLNQAAKWFQLAAEGGNARGARNLAELLENRNDSTVDLERAAYWYNFVLQSENASTTDRQKAKAGLERIEERWAVPNGESPSDF